MHLNKEDLIEIHRKLIELFGGAYGMLSEGTLDFAVTRAQRGKDFVEKAVTLLEIIAKEHPFVDGNKRTAFAAAGTTLRLSGYYLGVTDEDAIDFILKVARRELTHDQVVRWIKDRLKGHH